MRGDSIRSAAPLARPPGERLGVGWPAVERGRVEVRAVGPDERVGFRVDADGSEELGIAKRTVEGPASTGSKSMTWVLPSSNAIRSA